MENGVDVGGTRLNGRTIGDGREGGGRRRMMGVFGWCFGFGFDLVLVLGEGREVEGVHGNGKVGREEARRRRWDR